MAELAGPSAGQQGRLAGRWGRNAGATASASASASSSGQATATPAKAVPKEPPPNLVVKAASNTHHFLRVSLTNVFMDCEELLAKLKNQAPHIRKSEDRMNIWQKWGWLMTINLARLSPGATIETLDVANRRTPQTGFCQDQVESLYLMVENMDMLNALGVAERCVTMLCTDDRSVWNDEVPPSVLEMDDIDMVTDSTSIVIAGSKTKKKKRTPCTLR